MEVTHKDQHEVKSDNTRVTRPLFIERIEYKPKQGEYFVTVNGKKTLVKPTTVSSDNRSSYQRKQDDKNSEFWRKQYERADRTEKGLKNFEGFTKLIFPSTYIGPIFNNNGKSYVDNVISGERTGNEEADAFIDIVTPFTASVAKSLVTKFPYKLGKWTVNKGVQKDFNLKQLSEEKKIFLQNMDAQGVEFKGSREHPKLADYIKEEFLRPSVAQEIVPKKGSDLSNYLNWMDENFNIHTPKVAIASPSIVFKEPVSGNYNTATNIVKINTKYPQYLRSIFIHESGSHGTDMQVADRVIKNYPFKLQYQNIADFLRADIGKFRPESTIQNIYNNIAGIRPGLKNTIKSRFAHRNFNLTHGTNSVYDSNRWYEARATLNEARAELFKQKPDSWKDFGQVVDQTSDQEIINLIADTNGYGNDYYRAYILSSPKQQKEWMGRVRHALKYLPATTPFILENINNE